MFCAATDAMLRARQSPRPGYGTWSHGTLPEAVRAALAGEHSVELLRQVSTRLRHGYKPRLIADYDPLRTIDSATARRCVGYATAVLEVLRVSRCVRRTVRRSARPTRSGWFARSFGAHAANGISLEVTWVDSFEEGWWRVGVRPDRAGIRADDYASLLTEVEERIRDVNGVDLVLVPVLG